MIFSSYFQIVALSSIFLCSMNQIAISAHIIIPSYLTHGHYNVNTDQIEECASSSNDICEQVDIHGKEEIWLFWESKENIAKLFVENVHEKFQLDQRSPERNEWRRISGNLINQIRLETSDKSLLSVAMTNVRFTDLELGMQTVWFSFAENESVPTVIHCYRRHHTSPQCVWVL